MLKNSGIFANTAVVIVAPFGCSAQTLSLLCLFFIAVVGVVLCVRCNVSFRADAYGDMMYLSSCHQLGQLICNGV